MAVSNQSDTDVWLTSAAVVAACALLFTVASFWWLHARRGRLESYEPHTYAAAITQEKVRLRFPLVLYNTGAIPIVVQNLRLRFPGELASAQPLLWIVSWPQIKPDKDDQYSFRAVFSVAGRTVHQMFPEFGASSLGFTLEARDYPAVIEAKLGHKKEWRPLLKFTFRASHIVDPAHYITYDNTPGSLSNEQQEKAVAALGRFAQELALDARRAD
ncbi:MAG: hypothetical protein LC776_15665 [Acidobacteria bacterium]|nr:hypothetical protein [Acidobacteriota bacterium]